jgi:hypothetical protein
MAHQPHRCTLLTNLILGEIQQLLHQMGPIAAHRVTRIMAKLINRGHRHAALAQVLEQNAVGSRTKTVGVRKHQRPGQCSFRSAFRRAC